jgi:hypothetical protein
LIVKRTIEATVVEVDSHTRISQLLIAKVLSALIEEESIGCQSCQLGSVRDSSLNILAAEYSASVSSVSLTTAERTGLLLIAED